MMGIRQDLKVYEADFKRNATYYESNTNKYFVNFFNSCLWSQIGSRILEKRKNSESIKEEKKISV